MENNNMKIYESFRSVPESAKKTIRGGKLNGMTDISPMWRVKSLTEKFGPVGFGWYTEITEHWVDIDEERSESVAWVRLNLYVCLEGQWSQAIEGIGGSKYAGKGQGDGMNDEVFKMAETDALSVACKKLGMGADVYWDKDSTKYTKADSGGNRTAKSGNSQYRPVAMDSEKDAAIREWLRQCAAKGYNRDQCEATANKSYGLTIPVNVWESVVNETL